jgi:hypothetical protein
MMTTQDTVQLKIRLKNPGVRGQSSGQYHGEKVILGVTGPQRWSCSDNVRVKTHLQFEINLEQQQ